MSEWSQLPRELLDLIAHRLESPFYTLRLRSVCSSWRSSVSPKRNRLPAQFPFLPNYGISDATWGFHLSRRTIFLIGPPKTRSQTAPGSWLVKIEEGSLGRMRVLNPLSRIHLNSLPEEFPKAFDLLNFPVFELDEEYVLHYVNYKPLGSFLGDVGSFYREKVVFMCLDSERDDFALLTIHVSGRLAMFKSEDKKWTIVPDMTSPYDDVILFKCNFYAVDNTGKTVLVGLCKNVNLVAESVFGGDKKILVESGGELLLVDVYLNVVQEGDSCSTVELYDDLLPERTVRFEVFKLVEEEKKWVEVDNLQNMVLFLGDDSAFSASVSDLSGCKGNCILFTDTFFCTTNEENGLSRGTDIGVFDLDSRKISPLADYPEYLKLFWPPPDWVESAFSGVQSRFEELAVQSPF